MPKNMTTTTNLNMNKKYILTISFLFFALNIILSLIFSFKIGIHEENVIKDEKVLGISNSSLIYNSQENGIVQASYISTVYQDYRAFILDKYFEKYNSPLKGYGNDFIVACDKYNLTEDCTIIPAIAYVETGLCTLGISAKQFNCWGYGGSNSNRVVFNNFSNSIDTVTRILASSYGSSIFNPLSMAHNYCGSHCNNWGEGVNTQRNEIKQLSKVYYLPDMK